MVVFCRFASQVSVVVVDTGVEDGSSEEGRTEGGVLRELVASRNDERAFCISRRSSIITDSPDQLSVGSRLLSVCVEGGRIRGL
jgi:hypothetical protein